MHSTNFRTAPLGAALAAVCASAVIAHKDALAADVALAWDPGASGTSGYAVYSGEAIGVYSNRNDVGAVTTIKVQGLVEGTTYYFAVTAYDAAKLESRYSNEVSVAIPSGAAVVDFSASPLSGKAPMKVTFDNATTGQVTSWAWSFGDGGSSTGEAPTHVYCTPGDYWVTLKATGPAGSVSKTLPTPIKIAAPRPGTRKASRWDRKCQGG
jgi:PKD repeat protein